eukprot:m.156677 g.156677  ORF g.156677 m.156677 type:complete len:120 (+) comp52934_c0_seq1:107-466(+)
MSIVRGVGVVLVNWPMALIRAATQPNVVKFRIDPRMNKLEVREYLDKIYNVKAQKIATLNQQGKEKRTSVRGVTRRRPDYKIAYVTLAEGETFEFPSLFQGLKTDLDTKKELDKKTAAK